MKSGCINEINAKNNKKTFKKKNYLENGSI